MDSYKTLISDISRGKFTKQRGKTRITYHQDIKNDPRFLDLENFINLEYVKNGIGFKSLIKYHELDISYTKIRNLIRFMGIEFHSDRIASDSLKTRRRIIARENIANKTGMYSYESQQKIKYKHTSTSRGIQGYYWNEYLQKYVWLRSSWEFIYAKWLNKNKISWKIEAETFKLENTCYRPDFFIYNENHELISIVEIKGFWKNRTHKVEELKLLLKDIDIVLVTDIMPYCTQTFKKEVETWKSLRRSK